MGKINLSSLNLFITSRCNSLCKNCFYKDSLNKRDDLDFKDFEALSKSLGNIKTINISGGEPFLRIDLPQICELFVKNNAVTAISIPSNGLLGDKICIQVENILKLIDGKRIVVCFSLDGYGKIHDSIRGIPGNFERTKNTYKSLVKLKRKYPNLSVRLGTTVFKENYESLFKLYSEAQKLFPGIDAITMSLGRPMRFGQKQIIPTIDDLKKLFLHKQNTADKKRFVLRKMIEKMFFVASLDAFVNKRQAVPCLAGSGEGVVFANGDVGLCEMLPTVGNIKRCSMKDIWASEKARKQRKFIEKKFCYCTHEGFLFHSMLNKPWLWPKFLLKSLIIR